MLKIINLLGREVTYNLQRKKVKNLNLRIKPDGSLYLSANNYVSQKNIDEFLQNNAVKIIETIDKFSKIILQNTEPLKYETGDKIHFLGNQTEICVSKGNKNSAVYFGDKLFLTVKNPNDRELKENIIEEWYKNQAIEIISKLCSEAYPKFASSCLTFPTLRFRKMKSTWGNCRNEKGILTFNTQLVKHPIAAVEYVVYHEFVHFIHQNHSKSFYNELAKYIPDYKQRKQMLKNII